MALALLIAANALATHDRCALVMHGCAGELRGRAVTRSAGCTCEGRREKLRGDSAAQRIAAEVQKCCRMRERFLRKEDAAFECLGKRGTCMQLMRRVRAVNARCMCKASVAPANGAMKTLGGDAQLGALCAVSKCCGERVSCLMR